MIMRHPVYWKLNFPMTLHVHLSVGRLAGRSVINCRVVSLPWSYRSTYFYLTCVESLVHQVRRWRLSLHKTRKLSATVKNIVAFLIPALERKTHHFWSTSFFPTNIIIISWNTIGMHKINLPYWKRNSPPIIRHVRLLAGCKLGRLL